MKIGIDIAGRRVVLEQDSTDPFACPPSVAAIAPASGFYPSVDVAHGLSEAAERRMRGRGEVEGEGLPLLPSSHGAAQLSGRAREVCMLGGRLVYHIGAMEVYCMGGGS